jgi:hypothetical protein
MIFGSGELFKHKRCRPIGGETLEPIEGNNDVWKYMAPCQPIAMEIGEIGSQRN